MKILGIEFAPLSLPLDRRLQTFAVFYYCTNFLLIGFTTLTLLIYFSFTQFYYVSFLYIIWYLYDSKTPEKGGRRSEWLRNWKFWKYFADYFPVTLIKTAELDPNKNYIFGYHPHGLLSFGAFTCFATEGANFKRVFPGIKPRVLTLDGQFRFPLHREHIMFAGVCSASKESIKWNLTREGKGNALVLVIGGAAEALDAHPGKATLVLRNRRGFIKMALKYGASLVPIFAFGENDIFAQVENPQGSLLRDLQNKFKSIAGFSTPLFHGRGIFQYNFGLMPFRRPINVVVGKPIDVEPNLKPSDEQINELHEKYIESLKSLFEEHKAKYAPNVELTI